ncbi:MAG: TonB-dependent receptor [Phocaeicola sp.]|nr:TonB-dependent receptor [Phocaeicola sp.]MDD7448986.1 TonB-dependent receptor [Prevotellaceae bacterium]MDY3914405.1 TonB-dependent receptor [Phocaeicola sp.]MDY5938948.1 TonB-dependent receptor [Phocaeicola sp.]
MKKKLMLMLTFFFIGIGVALAQTQKVTGQVISEEDGEPVIGASVYVKGNTSIGTITDVDGNFTLTGIPASAKFLIVSFIGFTPQDVAIKPVVKVVLKSDAQLIDDVIVVAYGTAKKSSFTGAATSVDSKKLAKVQAPDAAKALEGMVPGLQISNSTGAPGSAATIRVRGIGSINASSEPLIILNGAPYSGSINSINPADIENISVLKDAASAALYGARGANGVIIITTKGGSKGVTSVTFDARIGVNQRGVPEYDVLTDPKQFYMKYWEALKNYAVNIKGVDPAKGGAVASDNLYGYLGYNIYNVPDNQIVLPDGTFNPNATLKYEDADFNDWKGLLLKPRARQEYNLSLTHGGDKSSTYFSVGYLNDKGYARATNFERLTSRLSYNTEFYKWLKMSAGSQFTYTTGNFGIAGNAYSNVFFFTRDIPPIYPVYKHDANGKLIKENGQNVYDTGEAVDGVNDARAFSAGKNIVGETDLNKDQYKNYYLTSNVRFDIALPYGFNFNTTLTHSFFSGNTVESRNPIMGDGVAYGGILTKGSNVRNTINWNQVLTWDKQFGDVKLQAMLGHESYMYTYSTLSGEKRNTLVTHSLELNTYAQITELTSGKRDYRVEGYFGQITGDYRNKYYFSASYRRDASSVFARDSRWGSFWSLGASWRIKEENFLKDVAWLNNLKLRASIGQQGNDALYNGDVRLYTPYTNLYSIGSDGTNYSFGAAYKGNPNITWEKNTNISAGLEFAMFDNRLTGEFDFFTRKTTDMLFNEPVSKTTGFTSEPRNLGAMRNTGFEFSLRGVAYRNKDVEVTLGLNGTTYKNKILSLPERFKETGLDANPRILKEGGSIADLYLVKFSRVNPEDGDALYWIKNKEGVFEEMPSKNFNSSLANRQYVGSGLPKWEGGFDLGVTAYGFDFSTQFSYRLGGKMLDNAYSALMHTGSSETGGNWHKDILNSWTPENKNTNVPRVELDNNKLLDTSDMFLVNASYLSLRNITLGYTLPNNWVRKMGMNKVRIYVTADNVFLLSERKGLDPRTSLIGSSSHKVASAIRTISGGISISL